MINTYILHYSKLTERKEFFQKHLALAGFKKLIVVESLDKENMDVESLKYYDSSEERFLLEASATSAIPYRPLKDSEISLCLKNILALSSFVESDATAGIFLEDDCFFPHTNYQDIENIIENAPEDWDMIFLGGGFSHDICTYRKVYNNYLLADYPCTNTSSSIVYSKRAAIKILKDKKFGISWDWHLNYVCKVNEMNVYHTYPYIAKQNIFKSSIQTG